MSVRDWIIERLGGVTRDQFESRSWDVVLKAWNETKENTEGIITPDSSMKMAAVFACVRVLAEAVASVPLHHYERMADGGRKKADQLQIAKVLNNPNPFQTGFEYMEVLMRYLATWGNAYSQIEYGANGQIIELWPLPAQNIIDTKIEGGKRFYQYQEETGNIRWLADDVIWHLHGIGDGLTGYSPIGLMRQAVSLGLNAETFGNKFFSNDARPGIVVEHPDKLSEKALENLQKSWNEDHKGVSKSHRMRVLEEGMKLHEVGIPPQDAQFLETRKFQITEIARIFRVPPHMIADLERASFSNIEHQGIEFVKYSILPWAKRIESSIYKHLYVERERLSYYPEFLLAGLERGDITSRYSAYATARQWGWMSANDVRKMENQDPIKGGDIYFMPLNMVPADSVAESSKLKAESNRNMLLQSVEVEGFEPPTSRTRMVQDEKETRAMRSVNARHRLTGAFRRIMLETAERSIRREVNDVSAAARKMLGNRNAAEFNIWLEEFYKEHIEFMTRQFLPVFLSFAESIAAEAQDEVQDQQDLQERLERFVRAYTGSFAYSQSQISLKRLQDALQEALTNGEDAEERVNAELTHWKDARPAEMAMDQSTRSAGAVAKFVYSVAGILALRWVTMGDSCPYCKAMDGRTISINKLFLAPGEEFKPDGAESPMTTTTDIGHPPLHGGCDCSIRAG